MKTHIHHAALAYSDFSLQDSERFCCLLCATLRSPSTLGVWTSSSAQSAGEARPNQVHPIHTEDVDILTTNDAGRSPKTKRFYIYPDFLDIFFWQYSCFKKQEKNSGNGNKILL